VLLFLRTKRVRPIVHRAETARLDVVVIIANAAIQNDEVVIIGGVDQITACGVDGDLGRQPDNRGLPANVRKGELADCRC